MRTSLLSYKMPEISGPKTGTFAKIPEHAESFFKRSFETSYNASYSKDVPNFKSTCEIANSGQAAAVSTNYKGKEQIKISTELISELYNNGQEPKYNTEIQRCWIRTSDPGVTAIRTYPGDNLRGNKQQLEDNELSLPMKDGFNELKKKLSGDLKYRRSDITKKTLQVTNLRK